MVESLVAKGIIQMFLVKLKLEATKNILIHLFCTGLLMVLSLFCHSISNVHARICRNNYWINKSTVDHTLLASAGILTFAWI